MFLCVEMKLISGKSVQKTVGIGKRQCSSAGTATVKQGTCEEGDREILIMDCVNETPRATFPYYCIDHPQYCSICIRLGM